MKFVLWGLDHSFVLWGPLGSWITAFRPVATQNTLRRGAGDYEQEWLVATEALLEPSRIQAGLDCWTSALGPEFNILGFLRSPQDSWSSEGP